MNAHDAKVILKAAGATPLQAEQFVGKRPTISAAVVAGAVAILKRRRNNG